MSQPLPEAENRVEMSHNLRATLQRAGSYATEQSHRFVTIEHILLALNEDPEAELMLQACSIDQGRLNIDVSNYLGLLEDRVTSEEANQPVLDPEAARIVNSAVIAAQKSRRAEVNGAIVLAAIIGDGRTPAANMLRAQGLTFQGAIEALQSAQAASQPRPSGNASLPHMVDGPGAGDAAEAQPIPPAANQNRMPPLGPSAQNSETPGAPAERPASTTENILADARRRINATREAAAERLPPPASEPPPAIEQPSSQYDSAPAEESSFDAGPEPPPPMEPPAAPPSAEPQAPVPPPPRPAPARPLQSEDSLARFERRPPPMRPGSAAGPAESGVAPPPPDTRHDDFSPAPDRPMDRPAFPVPPDAQPRSPAPPPGPPPVPAAGPPPDRLSDRLNPPAQSGFGGEALRRPPPPTPAPSPAPPPQPMQPQQPPPHAARPPHDGYGTPRPDPAAAGRGSSQQLPVPAPQPPARSGTGQINPGQLVENIPRRMRMGVSEIVEIRIARADLQNLATGMQGREGVYRHDLVITRAMSVRLRAPEGGFFIETGSPETQWIENQLGVLSDEYASWRWTVTPQRTGRARLQLIVSARTVGSDGLAAETALPDQIFEVRVRTNYKRLIGRWTGWIAAAVIGGLLAKFGEQLLTMGQAFLNTNLGG